MFSYIGTNSIQKCPSSEADSSCASQEISRSLFSQRFSQPCSQEPADPDLSHINPLLPPFFFFGGGGTRINPLNAELNPICHLLSLLVTHPVLHVSRLRVKRANIEIYFRIHVSYRQFFSFWPVKFPSGRQGTCHWSSSSSILLADDTKQIPCPCHRTYKSRSVCQLGCVLYKPETNKLSVTLSDIRELYALMSNFGVLKANTPGR